MSTLKAVCVGINTYPGCPLQGCVNDTVDLSHEAAADYNFPHHNIRMLLNSRATTAGILKRLDWLCYGAQPGDVLLFQYSGHGAQVPNRNDAGELDHLSEVICPYDFDWSPEKMVTDKQLVSIFSKLPHGVRLFWVSDSCHSGDLDRKISQRVMVPKAFSVPPDVRWSQEGAVKAGHAPKHIKEFLSGKLEVAFIPGCKSNQTSADTQDEHGRPCGALTHYFIKALHALPKSAAVKDLVDWTRNALTKDHYDQLPFAEGALIDKPFLQ